METGTLKELNVQPGDVVEYIPSRGKSKVGRIENGLYYPEGSDDPYLRDPDFRIISRAKHPLDLTAITAPFGLLDDVHGPGAQDALRAHGGPYEWFGHRGWQTAGGNVDCWVWSNTYRVKPQPKRETVTHSMSMDPDTGYLTSFERQQWTPVRVTFDRVDGEIDLASYRLEARS